MEFQIDSLCEHQYNNRAAVPEHPAFLESWRERSEKFRHKAEGIYDLAYAGHPRCRLDLFPVAGKSPAPLHVFIHGGYWQALDKQSFSYLAEPIHQNGECAAILNYGLCPEFSIIQIMQQIRQAITWLMAHAADYGADAGRMQISGHSAGGHLLAGLLCAGEAGESEFDVSAIRQLNAISGLFDLTPLLQTSINRALQLDAASARTASPLFCPLRADISGIRMNLLVGELESEAYHGQTRQLAQSWQTALDIRRFELAGCHHFSIVDAFFASSIWKRK